MENVRKLITRFPVLLLSLVLLSFVLFAACPGTESPGPKAAEDGDYEKTYRGHLSDVKVSIKVEGGQLTSMEIDTSGETAGLGGAAAAYLKDLMLAYQTTKLDVVSGASTTSAAVLAAASDCFEQAGLASRDYTPPASVTLNNGAEYDVVVVGGGASGFAATMAAWEKGAKVLVLEQTPQLGGLSLTAFGALGAHSYQQQNAHASPFGMPGNTDNAALTAAQLNAVSPESLFEWIQVNYNHFRSNGNLVQAILQKSGSTIDWLNNNGIQTVVLKGVDQGRHTDYPKTYHMWGAFSFFSPINQFTTQWQKMRGYKIDPTWAAPAAPVWVEDAALIPSGRIAVQVEFFTRGQKLIMNGNSVAGVEAVRANGQQVTVKAKQVILTTGGYGADRERFMDKTGLNYYNYFGYGNHGDGIRMAQDIGADAFNDNIAQIHMSDPAGTPSIGGSISGSVGSITDLPHLWVDLAGNRFTDETAVYDNVFWGNAAYSVGGKYFIIYDQATIDDLKTNGGPYLGNYGVSGVGYFDFTGTGSDGYATAAQYIDGTTREDGATTGTRPRITYAGYPKYNPGITGPDGGGFLLDADGDRIPRIFMYTLAPLDNLQTDLDSLITNHPTTAYKGTNLADLAAKTGMDPTKLAKAVSDYNDTVDRKLALNPNPDTQFFKNKKFVTWKVNPNSTVYAIAMQGSTYGSIGGVRINESIQALTSEGKVVPNLYVGGADAGGMWDASYPDLEGLSQAFAMNSGRIAGENAATASGH
ncbi:MAG: FAD-binding protein [Treponema sp.]|nr:FAD-binding protein [Treponema sp.]